MFVYIRVDSLKSKVDFRIEASPLTPKFFRNFEAMNTLLVNGWRPTNFLTFWHGGPGVTAAIEDGEPIGH